MKGKKARKCVFVRAPRTVCNGRKESTLCPRTGRGAHIKEVIMRTDGDLKLTFFSIFKVGIFYVILFYVDDKILFIEKGFVYTD